jgi:hypothetical protein
MVVELFEYSPSNQRYVEDVKRKGLPCNPTTSIQSSTVGNLLDHATQISKLMSLMMFIYTIQSIPMVPSFSRSKAGMAGNESLPKVNNSLAAFRLTGLSNSVFSAGI